MDLQGTSLEGQLDLLRRGICRHTQQPIEGRHGDQRCWQTAPVKKGRELGDSGEGSIYRG